MTKERQVHLEGDQNTRREREKALDTRLNNGINYEEKGYEA